MNSSKDAGAGLVQYPCFGGANQQWYLSVDQGNSDISGQTKVLWIRSSGLVADVSGASTNGGTGIDQWYRNGEWNQQWYFVRPSADHQSEIGPTLERTGTAIGFP